MVYRYKNFMKKHGLCGTPEYHIWADMVQRCENPNAPEYKNYGGRGIAICYRWRKSAGDFVRDVGFRPTPKHEIERINNNGNYEPGNCKWETRRNQILNSRHCHRLIFNGESFSLSEWAIRLGIKCSTLSARINTMKWPIHRALTEKVQARIDTKTL